MSSELNRRDFMKGSLLTAAALGAGSALGARASSPAPEIQPAGTLPAGTIGKLQVSRVILGGNLVNLFTHSRDLNYVRDLAERYHTDEKILETLAAAERNGVNTMSLSNRERAMGLLKKHRQAGGKLQWIVCPITQPDDMTAYRQEIEQLVADGCDAIYMHGGMADRLVSEGKIDVIAKAVEIMKMQEIPAGVGGHDIAVVEACEKAGIPNDFYIKTFHHLNYPTAPRPDEMEKSNAEVPGYWCKNWEALAERMKSVKKTWIAFKIMAAGAIKPKDAFQWAFENGGDHILAGMFDWQIAEDTALARTAIENAKAKRQRPWCS